MAATTIVSGLTASCRHFPCRPFLSSYFSLHLCSHTPHTPHSLLHRYRGIVKMTTRRRVHGNGNCAGKAKSPTERDDRHPNEPSNTNTHAHTHSHGFFGHSHSHSHDHHGHDHGGGLIETLQSGGAHPSHPTYLYIRTAHNPHSSEWPPSALFLLVLASYRVVS